MSALPTAATVVCPVCGAARETSCVNGNTGAPTAEHQSRDQWAAYVTKCRPFVITLTEPAGDLPAGQELVVRKIRDQDAVLAQKILPEGSAIEQEIPLSSIRFVCATSE